MIKWMSVALGIIVFAAAASFGVSAQQNQMSFFVTSVGPGNGANLGGLAGADKHCQTLAAAAGRRQPHVARIPQRRGGRRPAGRQRQGPHRQGSMDERQGRGDREGCR